MKSLSSNVEVGTLLGTDSAVLSAAIGSHEDVLSSAIRSVVQQKRSLTRDEARAVMSHVLSGGATDAQISALLVALQHKGETADELVGFAEAIREAAIPLPGMESASTRLNDCKNIFVDTCGTGGDGKATFNISTVAAFILAGAEVKVTKHGNRGISSRCGSADVLEASGVKVNLPVEFLAPALNEIGIAFLFAPFIHPAFSQIQQVRREIKVKSVFNVLGPLTNPAQPSGQVVGVYSEQAAFPLASALMKSGVSRAFVVYGDDGLDEITITGPTTVLETRDYWLRTYRIMPEELGIARAPLSAIEGGNVAENSRILRAVLSGERSPRRDIALMNAAAGFVVAGKAECLKEGISLAKESLDSGFALKKLKALIEFTNDKALSPLVTSS